MRRLIPALLALATVLPFAGCLSTSLSDEWSDPSFSWDTLKRDQILMTPLLDLRGREEPKFYAEAKTVEYAEAFKQRFFELRKDIRVFGAGGAFEYVAGLRNLKAIGRAAFARTPLGDADLATLRSGNQEIRFLMVFAITEEVLDYDVGYTFRKDQRDDLISYYSRRKIRVQMALWDAKENKTQWVGTKVAEAANDNQVAVANPSKVRVKKKKDGKEYYEWHGQSLSISLDYERREHAGRFPEFPGRTGLFEGTFDDLALGFPIQPSEEKLLEYSYFTYHRPEVAAGLSTIGSTPSGYLKFGSSSILNNRFRFGGFLALIGAPTLRYQGENFDVGGMALGLTADLEFAPAKDVRLLTGTYLGWVSYSIKRTADAAEAERDPEAKTAGESDSAAAVWPRVRLLFGERSGFQWGPEISYRWLNGIEAPLLLEQKPAPLAIEIFAATAFRGF